jgi:protein-tyrosine phosphatase
MKIAELVVGGGVLGLGPMPGRSGSYKRDLAEVLAWRPMLALTMATADELEAQGAGSLPGDLGDAGVDWVHLPVGDYGVPAGETAVAWPGAAQKAREVLARKGRVWVHCMGGCGRSGTVALRLMVEAGEEPGAALKRLRQVRPCAVETPEQFCWAAGGLAEGGAL